MAWGVRRDASDLVASLRARPERVEHLTVLPHRTLDRAGLAALCAAVGESRLLRELSLSSHRIDAVDAMRVGDALRANASLRALSVGDSSFDDAALTVLCAGLAQARALERLDLSHRAITAASMPALGRAVAAAPSLRDLDLSHSRGLGRPALDALLRRGAEGARAAADGGETKDGDERSAAGARAGAGAGAGAGASPVRFPRLRTLNLSSIGLRGEDPETERALAAVLRAAPGLAHLDVGGVPGSREAGPQAEGAQAEAGPQAEDAAEDASSAPPTSALAEALSSLASLEHVSLERSRALAHAHVLRALAALPRLRALILAGNEGGAAELREALVAEAAAEAVQEAEEAVEEAEEAEGSLAAASAFPFLERLDLSDSRADDAALVALCEALAPPGRAPRLAALDLSGARPGPRAAAALRDMARGKPRLRELRAHDCGIDGETLLALLEDDLLPAREGNPDPKGEPCAPLPPPAAPAFASLRELNLSGNRLDARALRTLVARLTPRPGDAAAALPLPRLETLVLAANPGVEREDDELRALLGAFARARPGVAAVLSVADRGGDAERAAAFPADARAIPNDLD